MLWQEFKKYFQDILSHHLNKKGKFCLDGLRWYVKKFDFFPKVSSWLKSVTQQDVYFCHDIDS